MLTAIVLARVDQSRVNDIAQTIADAEGVSEVFSVTGEWDLVVIIRVKENEQLARIVTEKITKIEGIVRTHTLMAFQAYSRYDLEHMFSVGFTEK